MASGNLVGLTNLGKVERQNEKDLTRTLMYKATVAGEEWVPHSLTSVIEKFISMAEKFFAPKPKEEA